MAKAMVLPDPFNQVNLDGARKMVDKYGFRFAKVRVEVAYERAQSCEARWRLSTLHAALYEMI